MAKHLGYDQHDPVGRTGARPGTGDQTRQHGVPTRWEVRGIEAPRDRAAASIR